MKRKIIGLARATHVVTLPNAWIEQHALKKGDEIEMFEHEHSLVIEPLSPESKLVTDVSGFGKHAKRFLNTCYKAGYNTIKVTYSTDEEKQMIEEGVHDYLIGLEITESDDTAKTITITSLGTMTGNEFNTILKRIFFIIKQSLAELQKEDADADAVIQKDKDVNKYADYCRRILNINALRVIDTSYKRNIPLYTIVEQLEKIGDDIRDLAREQFMKARLQIVKLAHYFDMLYTLFYSFDPKAFHCFVDAKQEILSSIDTIGSNNVKERMYCFALFQKMYDLNGPISTLYL